MLKETAQEFGPIQFDGGELAGFAFAIGPQDFAFWEELDPAIGGGRFKDVAGEIAQGVFAGAGGLNADIPGMLPDFGGHLREPGRMFIEQSLLEEGAHVSAQSGVMEKELL